MEKEQVIDIERVIDNINKKSLILFNDDVNSFEHVILCLVDYCGHTFEQAEQCAWLVHHKGQCDVKTGSYNELLSAFQNLSNHNLTVTIK